MIESYILSQVLLKCCLGDGIAVVEFCNGTMGSLSCPADRRVNRLEAWFVRKILANRFRPQQNVTVTVGSHHMSRYARSSACAGSAGGPPFAGGVGSAVAARWKNCRKAGELWSSSRAKTPNAAAGATWSKSPCLVRQARKRPLYLVDPAVLGICAA